MTAIYETNLEVMRLLKKEDIFKWQVAKKLGIHETTFVRWFRNELTKEQVDKILSAVDEIKQERVREEH